MGLRDRVADLATARPRVYVVEAPGGSQVHSAAWCELDRRGWQPAHSPASADALLIAGALPESLRAAADALWSQLPGPRARAEVVDLTRIHDTLDGLRESLRDRAGQGVDRRGRELDEVTPWLDHGDRDHDDMDHGDMDHGDMEMAPGGIALADGAEDRDGLEMDFLRHPLGPLLDRWPGGLELIATLHGDVVADAEIVWWEPSHHPAPPEDGRDRRAAGWNAAAAVLSLIGDELHARMARSRAAVSPEVGDRVLRRLDRLTRRGVLPRPVGEVLRSTLVGPGRGPVSDAELVALVSGRDVGDVRLLVAAHAPLLHGVTDAARSGS